MPLAIWPVDQNLKIFMNKPARGDTYCSPIGGSVLCASTFFPCHTEPFPNILYAFMQHYDESQIYYPRPMCRSIIPMA